MPPDQQQNEDDAGGGKQRRRQQQYDCPTSEYTTPTTEDDMNDDADDDDVENGQQQNDDGGRFRRRSHGSALRESFVVELAMTKGAPQILILCVLIALGAGSTIGVVPALMMDRYARLNHGYDGDLDCADYLNADGKPQACLNGSNDAQNAAAVTSFVSNILTFFTSSLVGSLSDEHGRKGFLLFGVLLSLLSPVTLFSMQLFPSMSPFSYYFVGTMSGLVDVTSISISALSDVVPPMWRAPSFGLILSSLSLGIAIAPSLAMILGHFGVTVLSLSMLGMGFVMIACFFPETLPPDQAQRARQHRKDIVSGMNRYETIAWNMKRPIYELSILNRSTTIRLLSSLAFFSGIVSAGDRTLLLYYLEEWLDFNDQDIAAFFVLIGISNILLTGCFLKFLNDCFGERKLLVLAFTAGSINNFLYGIANSKTMAFIACAIGSLCFISFPTVSAIKSNYVEASEQGRIQGALFSLKSLASACGPVVMRIVYHYTKDGDTVLFGPGSMFIVGGFIYMIAMGNAYALPLDVDSKKRNYNKVVEEVDDRVPTENTSLLHSN